ncbi:MAG: HAMP domain-containing histidine kinase [Chromatiales bacterium]|nr:HAMP domain-containing histidine kinase [Chromatiales bacterium]
MKHRRHSLSGRLLVLFLVTGLALALVVRSGFRYGLENNLRELTAPHLNEYIQHLLDELGDPPSPQAAARLEGRLPLDIVLSRERPDVAVQRHIERTLENGIPVSIGRVKGGGFAVEARVGEWYVLFLPRFLRDTEVVPLVVVLTIAGILLVLVLAYHAIRRLFRPIEAIRAGVARIGHGELDHRLDIPRRDELGELADSINSMADDIQGLLEAKRELLLAISHELRSPLTRARVNAELVEASPVQQALLADLGELETLLNELLESERLRGRHVALDRQAVDPSELLSALCDQERVVLELDPPGTWLSLDPVRIRLLARNLLRNAQRHTREGDRPVVLRSHADDREWRLEVEDFGAGVAQEHIRRLTEPFYRADPSRQRSSGGVGLGLYLSRAIVEAHGGQLVFESEEGEGTLVRVIIPLE